MYGHGRHLLRVSNHRYRIGFVVIGYFYQRLANARECLEQMVNDRMRVFRWCEEKSEWLKTCFEISLKVPMTL